MFHLNRLYLLFILSAPFILPYSILAKTANKSATTAPKRVAILELKNQAPDDISQGEIDYLSNEIRRIAGYLPHDQYLIMTKENMEQLIPPDRTLEECVGKCEVETGQLLQADWIITGAITRFGSSFRVSIKVHQSHDGSFLKGESAKGKTIEKLEVPIQKATLKIAYAISPEFKKYMVRTAGPKINKQLKCIREMKCLTKGSSHKVKKSKNIRRKRGRRFLQKNQWKLSVGALFNQLTQKQKSDVFLKSTSPKWGGQIGISFRRRLISSLSFQSEFGYILSQIEHRSPPSYSQQVNQVVQGSTQFHQFTLPLLLSVHPFTFAKAQPFLNVGMMFSWSFLISAEHKSQIIDDLKAKTPFQVSTLGLVAGVGSKFLVGRRIWSLEFRYTQDITNRANTEVTLVNQDTPLLKGQEYSLRTLSGLVGVAF